MVDKSKRTIILSTIGSAGDVYPFIGIGQQLREHGRRVILVTSAYFESRALEAGLEFISLGSAEDYTSIIQDPRLWEPETGFKVFASKVITPIMRPLYEILSEFDPASTTLVAQGQVFGAHLANEKFGFPFLTIHLQPAAFRSVYEFPLLPGWLPRWTKKLAFKGIDHFVIDRELAPEINRFRDELSLPPIKNIFADWMHSPQANIGLFPDWFAPPQPDWPPQTHLTGFIFYDKTAQDQSLSIEMLDYLDAEKPPVIFTPGTAMKHGGAFFQASLEACQILNYRGIFLTPHKEQLPDPLPENIRHFEYLPFSLVLPRAGALIHHGGIGTTAQALSAGIPQIIRPMTHDQPDNAARVQQLGVGVSIDPKKYIAQKVARELDRLLTDPGVAVRCLDYAKRITPDRSLAETCEIIDQVGSAEK